MKTHDDVVPPPNIYPLDALPDVLIPTFSNVGFNEGYQLLNSGDEDYIYTSSIKQFQLVLIVRKCEVNALH